MTGAAGSGDPAVLRALVAVRPLLLGLAALLGAVMIVWVAVLIVQHFAA